MLERRGVLFEKHLGENNVLGWLTTVARFLRMVFDGDVFQFAGREVWRAF